MHQAKARLQFNPAENRLRHYAMAVIIAGTIFAVISVYFYSLVNDQWKTYSLTSSKMFSLQDRLVQSMGYGGFIHDFKNLVIRKDVERYEPKLNATFEQLFSILDELENYPQYDAATIDTIRWTLSEYRLNVAIAVDLIGKDLSTEAIDQQVKIDDQPALQALALFERDLLQVNNAQAQRLSTSFIAAFVVHITSVVLFVGVLLVYLTMLIKSNRKQAELTEKAQEGSTAKSQFLANMSHEIRTPLNGIMGVLQLLRGQLTDPKYAKMVNNALLSTHALLTILNDILDFSKIEANKLTLESVRFSISEIIDSVVADLLPMAQKKSIFIHVEYADNLPKQWYGDPVRLRQIVVNLTSNAVKFTEKGGVTVSVSHEFKHIQSELHIHIKDTGIGMTDEAKKRIFYRFDQADSTITRKFGGTGLGMAITQQLVKLMEGEIKLNTELDVGSTFHVMLPLEVAPQDSANNNQPTDTVFAPELSGISILIAEDNEINIAIIESMLEPTNAELFFAENGQQAIDAFNENQPDLVLMDIQMPVMDGVEACLLLRKQHPKVPIVALTANVMTEDVQKYTQAGFTDHIGKPVEIDDLYYRLTLYLQNSTPTAQPTANKDTMSTDQPAKPRSLH